jgi:FMN reductase
MTKLVAVLGSVTPPGRLSRATEWMLEQVRDLAEGVDTRLINLADYRLGFADGRPLEQIDDDTPAVVTAVMEADAVILATPVYRATYTGALKNLLDLVPLEGLSGKAVGIVSMGATSHHYLGADWHLRDVLAWYGAVVAPTSVYLSSADFDQGQLSESARADLRALADAVLRLRSLLAAGAPLGPTPLAGRR